MNFVSAMPLSSQRFFLIVTAMFLSSRTLADEPAKRIEPWLTPPEAWQNKLRDYRSPLKFADGTAVKSADDWIRRRREILTEWTELLGEWPPLMTQPDVSILDSERRENFMQHRVRFLWTPTELTTGYLLIPDGDGPHPAVVTVFYEPETAIGKGKPNRDFALQLTRRGFVTLSIGTTEASQAGTYALYYLDIDNAQVQPLSMLGCAAANAWYVLASRPEVWWQMGHVCLLPVRQICLRGLVRSWNYVR
jgi:hypothetical protein